MRFKLVENPQNLCVKCPKSLKEKVFIPKSSKCKYYFTIGKLGENLWAKTLSDLNLDDFVFFDPNNQECPVEYNPLFDKHLKQFFNRKNVNQLLRKNHLITDKNEVICTVNSFNDYRKSLYRLKSEGNFLKQKLKDEALQKQFDNAELKSRQVHKKSRCSQPNVKHMFKNYFLKKRTLMEEEKRKRFIENLRRYQDRVRKIELLKSIRDNEIKERGYYRSLEVVKKRILVIEKRKARQAEIKRRIFERDLALRKRLCVDESLTPVNYIIRCPLEV